MRTSCECYDFLCPAHRGRPCTECTATHRLVRMDMEDVDGTYFCDACTEDAMSSGVYSEWKEE